MQSQETSSKMDAAVASAKVLVVDDDPDTVEAMRLFLEDHGYVVAVAYNGRQALEHFKAGNRPDVVILDLLMPVMNGMEFLAERSHDPVLCRTPVIVVTASERQLHIDLGRDALLPKPVDFVSLLERIDSFGPLRPSSN